MSKFFEALERAAREEAFRTQASSPGPTADPPAPSVFETLAPTIELAVDRSHRIEAHLVSLLSPGSFEAEQYRMVRHIVETMRQEAHLQVVAVTSPGVGDGKTTTAINLAGALAQAGEARVLLVDIDLRRPAVTRQLGLGGSRRSLVDALLEPRLTLEDAVEHVPGFNLSVLAAGGSAVAPYELLKSPRLEALLAESRRRYDYVVLDTPPFVPVPDCRLIAKCVDGFFIVVAAHRTARRALAETLDLMGATVVGLIFNGGDARRPRYYGSDAGPSDGAWWRRVPRES
jgi:capsular exopolysaccharide synthesis family protein